MKSLRLISTERLIITLLASIFNCKEIGYIMSKEEKKSRSIYTVYMKKTSI